PVTWNTRCTLDGPRMRARRRLAPDTRVCASIRTCSPALWNIEHGVHCGRISVLMPVNFRPGDWHEEVVGNFSLLTRVSTTPHQRSLGRVLAAVQAQIRCMCDRDSMAALIEFLARASDLPIW